MKQIHNRKFTKEAVFTATEANYPYPFAALQNGCEDVKVHKKVAQEWLMHQETVVYQGTVYWLQIKPWALNLYQVKRRARENKETILVQEFEAK